MKHLNEFWNFSRVKDINVDDYLITNTGNIIKILEYVGSGIESWYVVKSKGGNIFNLNKNEIREKATPEEIEQYELQQIAKDYNL